MCHSGTLAHSCYFLRLTRLDQGRAISCVCLWTKQATASHHAMACAMHYQMPQAADLKASISDRSDSAAQFAKIPACSVYVYLEQSTRNAVGAGQLTFKVQR